MTAAAKRSLSIAVAVLITLGVIGLGSYLSADGRTSRDAKSAGKARAAVLITTAAVKPQPLEVYEVVIGTVENVIDPTVGAEVAGRVTRVTGFTGKKVARGELIAEIDAADFEIQSRGDRAEIGRLTSLLEQQERVVERQQKLVSQGFISKNAADDARSEERRVGKECRSWCSPND